MKSFVIALVLTVTCLGSARANWPWENQRETAWGWKSGCNCANGDKCTCGPNCQCLGCPKHAASTTEMLLASSMIGCKGKSSSSAGGMEMSDTYFVGSQPQTQCFLNVNGQRQCYQNGVLVPCDQPAVQYVSAPASAWAFPQTAPVDPSLCPCCGMKMTEAQMAAMKAKAAASVAAPVVTTYSAPMVMSGNCSSCGTGSAISSGSFRTSTGLFPRLRARRGGCGS